MAVQKQLIEATMESVSPALEYQSLREELLEAKKHVFERPLLILAIGAAMLNVGDGTQMVFLPALLAGLLIFNLWFTVNRLRSAARIVAYIQLVLEEHKAKHWIGWETALREYRIWLKTNNDEAEKLDEKLKKETVPDAFYPAIYQLQIGLSVMVVAAAIALYSAQRSAPALASLIVTVVITVALWLYCARWAPRDMANLVERDRKIWQQVLKVDAEDTPSNPGLNRTDTALSRGPAG
jgi:hypothetical protein